jgi:hypothetical protein
MCDVPAASTSTCGARPEADSGIGFGGVGG